MGAPAGVGPLATDAKIAVLDLGWIKGPDRAGQDGSRIGAPDLLRQRIR